MKLLVFIPCLNEANTIGGILDSIPKKLKNIDEIQTLIIDDGSDDKTSEIVEKYENVYLIVNRKTKGLAEAFNTALEYSIKNNVDIMLSLDGDNQYPTKYIQKLIDPIISQNFDIVIGNRQVDKISHFSYLKKLIHKLGTYFINFFLDSKISDPPSGMRAYSKLAMKNLVIMNKFSYTLETLYHADYLKLSIYEVLIEINQPTRKSRLFKSNFQYLIKSLNSLLSILVYYKSSLVLNLLSIPFYLFGLGLWSRYILKIIFFDDISGRFIPSIIVGGVFIIIGVMMTCFSYLLNFLRFNQIYLLKKISKK